MGGADNFKKISADTREMTHYAEEQRLGHGKIEFDELGNAIWVPNLAISDDFARNTNRLVQQNPQGLRKGYDPYDSGMLAKKQYKKKKDLKKLSGWITSRKPKED
jgi:hypothetical protein